MGETLTQRRRVGEDGLRVVNPCCGGRERTVPHQKAPANYVPAAAVKRRGRALPGVTGRKGRVGGPVGPAGKTPAHPGGGAGDGGAGGGQRRGESPVER
jgi:hypothetical protein